MTRYQNEMLAEPVSDLDSLLAGITGILRCWMNDPVNSAKAPAEKRMPPALLHSIMALRPLAVSMPEQAGGRGGAIKECLQLLSATSYESLEMSMIFGINMFLFLQPVIKYAGTAIKSDIFHRFLDEGQMGGFMLTEPDYGSDVLNLATAHVDTGTHYHISGTKHWQGLTGHATYWLIASRKKNLSGELSRDIDFFIADGNQEEQRTEVLKYYDSLGLHMLPYGLSKIDVSVPREQRLHGGSTGITMMLDILHNSRLQFPGMAMGFIQRMLDEAVAYCTKRHIGGLSLLTYDHVQYQISRIQAAYTICSAMCVKSCAFNSVACDASGLGLDANSMKTLVTDLMHESAQILLQLSGAQGYRLSAFAGRALIDSRPFRIFEGPNDVLYSQIAETILRGMKITGQRNLLAYLQQHQSTITSSGLFQNDLDFVMDFSLPQRKKVDLGGIIARIIAAGYVMELDHKGYRKDLIDMAILVLRQDVAGLFAAFGSKHKPLPVVDYKEGSDWSDF
ncbi:acyl-CoA dehydrogenase family protein [Taibaiella koreensis]|uniref:acyl-CoA dehydrogenase family protein n=1 Tax=Taibaiella koreensis TaxID=1268548 RepID=UPI000E59C62F|nr:acyl-CoA dehydrogenase family protein [Taibaiella koreensis]